MNRCPDNTKWVLYAADELPADERRILAAHLESCADCRREADALARGMAALSLLPQEAPLRPELVESLRIRLRPAARPRILSPFVRHRWIAAAAAAVLLIAGVWTVLLQTPPDTKRPTSTTSMTAWVTDLRVSDELTEIAAGVELLENSIGDRTCDAADADSNPAANDELDQYLETLQAEFDT